MKTTEIRLVSYENKVPCGYLISSFYSERMSFTGLFEVLTLIENIQDGLNYPQQSMDLRSFSETKPNEKQHTAELGDKEVIAIFRISVLFRQNSTWQGSLDWVNKDQSASFRSVWELVKLIDSALSYSGCGDV